MFEFHTVLSTCGTEWQYILHSSFLRHNRAQDDMTLISLACNYYTEAGSVTKKLERLYMHPVWELRILSTQHCRTIDQYTDQSNAPVQHNDCSSVYINWTFMSSYLYGLFLSSSVHQPRMKVKRFYIAKTTIQTSINNLSCNIEYIVCLVV